MYLYRTEHFGLTHSELHLLRSGFAHKKFNYSQIRRIELKKGIVTKHPVRLLIFGIAVITIPIFFLWFNDIGFNDVNGQNGFKVFGVGTVSSAFLLSIGLVSIFQTILTKPILKSYFDNGAHEVLSLSQFVNNDEMPILITFMMEHFKPKQLKISRSIINKYVEINPITTT